MSEDILQQLVKMVGMNNRHQLEMKKKLGEINEQLSQMKASLYHVENRLTNLEDDMLDIRGSLYRLVRIDRQLNKTVSRVDRLEVEMEMLQNDNS